MTGEPFFLTMAGISLSLAGFAGLLASFRQPSQPWTATDLWRLRRIVNRSLASVFPALSPVPLFGIIGDEAAAIRIASALFAAVVLADLVMLTPEWRRLWPGDRGLYVAWLISGSLGLLLAANSPGISRCLRARAGAQLVVASRDLHARAAGGARRRGVSPAS